MKKFHKWTIKTNEKFPHKRYMWGGGDGILTIKPQLMNGELKVVPVNWFIILSQNSKFSDNKELFENAPPYMDNLTL